MYRVNEHWLVKDKKIAPHIPVIDKSNRDDANSIGKTSRSTTSVTFTSAQRARFSQRQAVWSMMARRHCFISRASSIVVAAYSGREGVQRCLLVGFGAGSMRRLVTLARDVGS
jgi:hypothetical protein